MTTLVHVSKQISATTNFVTKDGYYIMHEN